MKKFTKCLSAAELRQLAQILPENKACCLACALDDIGLNPDDYDFAEIEEQLACLCIEMCPSCGRWLSFATGEPDFHPHT